MILTCHSSQAVYWPCLSLQSVCKPYFVILSGKWRMCWTWDIMGIIRWSLETIWGSPAITVLPLSLNYMNTWWYSLFLLYFFLSSILFPCILQVYNLRVEESYDPLHFHGRVETFPFDDHHIPPLQTIKLFCKNVHSWLSSHPKNIVVVHCMVWLAIIFILCLDVSYQVLLDYYFLYEAALLGVQLFLKGIQPNSQEIKNTENTR